MPRAFKSLFNDFIVKYIYIAASKKYGTNTRNTWGVRFCVFEKARASPQDLLYPQIWNNPPILAP
jgi:hypothetical protein